MHHVCSRPTIFPFAIVHEDILWDGLTFPQATRALRPPVMLPAPRTASSTVQTARSRSLEGAYRALQLPQHRPLHPPPPMSLPRQMPPGLLLAPVALRS